MRLPRIQFTVRRMMVSVSAVGIAMAQVRYLLCLSSCESPISILFGAGIIDLAFLLTIRSAIRLFRQDDSYAARLRRNDVPEVCPWLPMSSDPPQ
jgi:hypothetical protein